MKTCLPLSSATSILTLFLLSSCATSPHPRPSASFQDDAERRRTANIYLGQRSLDEDDYSPVEDQLSLGFEYTSVDPDSTFGWEFGFFLSGDSETVSISGTPVELTGSTVELSGGVVKVFGELDSSVQPYIGGGLAWIAGEVEASALGSSSSVDDSTIAPYVHGGVTFTVNDQVTLGLDLRQMFAADVEYDGFESDLDYTMLSVVLGYSF